MILLDTSALIWIDAGHPRVRGLVRRHERLYVSPASLLELQFLHEAGKVRLPNGAVRWVVDDDRWLVDEPPPAPGFSARSTRAGRGIRSIGCSWRTRGSGAGDSRRRTRV